MSPAMPAVLVVMGVSGSGKTTIAALLAGRLGWAYADGDDFHPPANVAKMRGGTPLTDEDRGPWLDAIAAWIDATRGRGRHGVIVCSALKRRYRDVLLGRRPNVRLVYLRGDKQLISARQAARLNHYMPAALVDSQFASLEEPGPDERPIVVSVEPTPGEIVQAIVAQLPVPAGVLDQAALKQQAADAAVAEVEDGMVVGLGTGSTAALAVAVLGARVKQGLRIVGIPTSERTAAQARSLGISLAGFDAHTQIDLTIDGADEVHTGTLDLIKGLGGALLREKIVAAASRRMTVVVDESKLVPALGGVRLPVEIVAFGHEATMAHLRAGGADGVVRHGPDGPFRTDGGNLIVDCSFAAIPDPSALHARLKGIVGVVETGLFIGMATRVIAGTQAGPRILELL